MKVLTILRLELCAAVMFAELFGKVIMSLEFDEIPFTLWAGLLAGLRQKHVGRYV